MSWGCSHLTIVVFVWEGRCRGAWLWSSANVSSNISFFWHLPAWVFVCQRSGFTQSIKACFHFLRGRGHVYSSETHKTAGSRYKHVFETFGLFIAPRWTKCCWFTHVSQWFYNTAACSVNLAFSAFWGALVFLASAYLNLLNVFLAL